MCDPGTMLHRLLPGLLETNTKNQSDQNRPRNRPSEQAKEGKCDSSINVRRDQRFVDDGDIVTTAGTSAGIDMAVHLVKRLVGIERTRQVRRGLHYDPESPI